MSRIVKCTHCHTNVDLAFAKRNCSNCFSCTDCERYICPSCDKEIVIKEVRKMNFHKK